ncbi:DUF3080 family protein [Congregibacter sp.]|uniref:DUF3080 family protein n=1 Tax=Congregibacter sp. TaxID=2744308 RepID=UPI003F6CA2E4
MHLKAIALLAVALSSLLIACSGGGQTAELANYLERLARPLNLTVGPVQVPSAPAPPRAESLRIALEGSKLDGLDFLRLRGCALQQTVARRNSSLGRVAPPSQRLLLELAFLRDAPSCVDVLLSEDRTALATVIQESIALKESQLPALIFNATLGNREYRDLWRARTAAKDYPAQTSSQVITALEQLANDAQRWMSGDYEADDVRVELALSEIARGDGGELLHALSRQAAHLTAANALIQQSLAAGPLCTENTTASAAPILRAVVSKFFIQQVQARAADINQRYYTLTAPIAELESLLSEDLPKDYQLWQKSRDASLDIGVHSASGHVAQLQSLLGVCYAEFASDDN